MAVLFLVAYFVTRRLSIIPTNAQSIAEIIIGGLYEFFSSVAGRHVKQFFPLLASIFIFVIASNWSGLLPGVGTIGFYTGSRQTEGSIVDYNEAELSNYADLDIKANTNQAVAKSDQKPNQETKLTPLFRAPTADLNTTIALALVAVLAIQYYGFKLAGLHYSTRFINIKNPIMFGVGILELASDISKIISFAFRLFGNIFAGEVLLAVIAFLIPVIVPLPFVTLELFVGFIQALVFSMLTAVFLNIAVSHGEEARSKEVTLHG